MSGKIRGLAVFACLFFFICGGLSAQSTLELQFGAWVSGNLYGNEQWFSVRSFQAGFIVVETRGDLDTVLEAYDASRNLLDEDDDGGEDSNAKLEIYADAGKTYLFKLRLFDDEESGGSYNISANYKPIPRAAELRFGDSSPESLKAGEEQWFSIRPSGTGFAIVETSGDLDTRLEAFDASYHHINDDDDGGDDYNARLEIYVEAGRIYYFKLRGYDEDVSGSYRIRAGFEPMPADTERNTSRSRAVFIRLGEAHTGFFYSSSESRWFCYDLSRTVNSFVVQTRGNLDTVITLYDSRGNSIAEDDDSGEGKNAMASAKPGMGTVYIEVKEYSGLPGRFTLHAEIR